MRPPVFDHAAILQRVQEGDVAYTNIATEFGCSGALVRKVAKRAGFPPKRSGPLRAAGYRQPAYWHEWLAGRQVRYCAWPVCSRLDNGPRDVDHDHACCSKERLGHERICGKCIRGLVHKGCNIEIAVLEKAHATGVAQLDSRALNYFSSRVSSTPTPQQLPWKYQAGPCGQCVPCKGRFKCIGRQ